MDKKAKTLKKLIELDYDAIEAYEEAIERLDNASYKQSLREFMQDHQRHTMNLAPFLKACGEEVPDGPDAMRFLTEGKVIIADLAGDKAILKAMNANEKTTNKAYEKALEVDDLDGELRQILLDNLNDEKRHKAWIERQIETYKESSVA